MSDPSRSSSEPAGVQPCSVAKASLACPLRAKQPAISMPPVVCAAVARTPPHHPNPTTPKLTDRRCSDLASHHSNFGAHGAHR